MTRMCRCMGYCTCTKLRYQVTMETNSITDSNYIWPTWASQTTISNYVYTVNPWPQWVTGSTAATTATA